MAATKKATKKKAAKKTTKKKAAKKATKKTAKKTSKKTIATTNAALQRFRDKSINRLEKINEYSVELGEELFGAIDAARGRYTDQWEKMRRKSVSMHAAIWKVRPSRDNVEELITGIEKALAELEAEWKKTSVDVKRTIKNLT